MANYRASRAPDMRRQDKSSPWRTIALIAVILGLGICALFTSGSRGTPNQDSRSNADISVRMADGPLLGIAVEAKEPVVVHMRIPVDVPMLRTKPGASTLAK